MGQIDLEQNLHTVSAGCGLWSPLNWDLQLETPPYPEWSSVCVCG